MCAEHVAGNRFADTYSQCLRCRFAFLDDIEVMVERGYFVGFGLRQLHLAGKRRQMLCRDMAKLVLNLVQMLDQHIGRARSIAEQRHNLRTRYRIDNASLGFALALSKLAFQ